MPWIRAFWDWLEADTGQFAEASQHALLLQQQGDRDQADVLSQHWHRKDPGGIFTLLYAGATALLRQQWQDAQAMLEQVVRSGGDTAEVLTLLGTAFLQLGDPKRALDCLESALQRNPDLPEAHRVRADVLRSLALLDQAIHAYSLALQLNPNSVQARWNLATTLLLAGEYEQGWHHYGVRFSPPVGVRPVQALPPPMLQGGLPEKGSKLWLVAEQGLGDTIQFARYALLLRQMGFDVSLIAQPALQGLLESSGLVVASPASDPSALVSPVSWLPLLSLPALLGVSPARPLVTTPYLQFPSVLPQALQMELDAEKRLLVALNWQGNASMEVSNFRGRSLPLEAFAPLAAVRSVAFLSVQKGEGFEQLEACSFRHRFSSCQELVDQLWDFREIAALISRCDLLITSDTAVAHLAGAIGHPVWLLLKQIPDWRWRLHGDTTFWYPSMRLFRQQRDGDWEGVMERVALALTEFAASR